MNNVSLKAQARGTEKTAKVLRRENVVPCVLYGNETENTTIQCDYSELYKAYVSAGGSTIVDIDIEGKSVPALFHDLSFDPVSDKIIHVDFYAVNMKKEIEAQIPLDFIGEAPAVKDLGGVLVSTLDHVTVRCLPANLPHALEVSIEKLETFADALHVSDVKTADGVEVLEDPEMMIATVQEPRKEAEQETPVEGEGEGEGGAAAEGGESSEGGDADNSEKKDEEKSE